MRRRKKYYIIGSGIVGCVIAHELADKGNQVQIFERRSHFGGNIYDYVDEHGIRIHKYGPHIFHTKNEQVWDYVSGLCKWSDYNLVCGAVIDGVCVPTAFDYTSVDTFFPNEAEKIKDHIRRVYGDRGSAPVLELLNSTDPYIRKFAEFLYEKDYAPYTAKQWGIEPEKVDPSVLERVPIRFSYDSKYFNDPYQVMPVNGYIELIENLINHDNITISLEKDALDLISFDDKRIQIMKNPEDYTVVYTGPIDELFGCRFGKLPYRSLRFEWKYEQIESFQDMPVVAYPQERDYTRITEYKKLPYQNVIGTSYAVEYPIPYRQGEDNEPYYPVATEESIKLFEKYVGLAKGIDNLICCGRLADFKYYNMDQAIERALEVSDSLLED